MFEVSCREICLLQSKTIIINKNLARKRMLAHAEDSGSDKEFSLNAFSADPQGRKFASGQRGGLYSYAATTWHAARCFEFLGEGACPPISKLERCV